MILIVTDLRPSEFRLSETYAKTRKIPENSELLLLLLPESFNGFSECFDFTYVDYQIKVLRNVFLVESEEGALVPEVKLSENSQIQHNRVLPEFFLNISSGNSSSISFGTLYCQGSKLNCLIAEFDSDESINQKRETKSPLASKQKFPECNSNLLSK